MVVIRSYNLKVRKPHNLFKKKYYKNYEQKLLQKIITGNYELVYQSRGKCEIHRDTGVSKNGNKNKDISKDYIFFK